MPVKDFAVPAPAKIPINPLSVTIPISPILETLVTKSPLSTSIFIAVSLGVLFLFARKSNQTSFAFLVASLSSDVLSDINLKPSFDSSLPT